MKKPGLISRFAAGRVLGRFGRSDSGATIVEFAFITPIMLLILLGAFDMSMYVYLNQKIDRAASTMSDLISRPSAITATEVNQLFDAAIEIARPFDLTTDGGVIITSVYKNPGENPKVTWQIAGGGPVTPPSTIGGVGSDATMPGSFVMRDNENVIVAEVYFDYEPIFVNALKNIAGSGEFLSPGIIMQNALRQPRLGDLSTLAGP